MRALSIGRLARAAKVSVDTIRFYEKCGLLPQPARRPSGFREYSSVDLQHLNFVRRARSIGFSLEEIRDLLCVTHERDRLRLSSLLKEKRSDIEARISELQQWRAALDELMRTSTANSRELILRSFERELAPQAGGASPPASKPV